MSFNLSKNDSFDLKKPDASPLFKIFLGLGWEGAKQGFFGFGSRQEIDLDASCLMFDGNKQLVDVVWFRQLKSQDGSIRHSGDNRTGAGDGDDEVINIDLQSVPNNVQHLVFTINSFTGQTFEKVESAYCRVVDASNQQEAAKFNLSTTGRYTALVMAKVSRNQGGWTVTALGTPANGRTVQDLAPLVAGSL